MVYRNCGNEIQGPKGGGKKKIGLIIGAAAAAVAVIALLAVAAIGLFASPKQKLEKAMVKSLSAYARAGEALDPPDLSRLTETRSVSQRMSLQLTGLNTAVTGYDLSALEGLGLRFQSDLDGADRKLGVELSAFWDDEELLSVLLTADDAEACFASAQLTGGDFYGVNTETLGEDLRQIGIQDAGDISFNVFELLDIIAPEGQAEESGQIVKQAAQTLFEAVQVEKAGKETISVNQTEIKTDVYRVTVPKEAVKDYVNAVLLSRADYAAVSRGVCRAMGLPENVLEEILGELDDVVLAVHVGGGYVSAVRYEGYMFDDDTLVKLELYLGGGKEYVDNLRLEIDVDSRKLTIDSSGDHGCKSGVFTDETTIRGSFSTMKSEFHYEPGGPQNDFSWALSIPGAGSLEMTGQLTGGGKSIDLHLDELCFKMLGMKLCSAEMDYYMGPSEGQSITASAPGLLGAMDSLELLLAMLNLRTSTQRWMEDMQELFISRLPSDLLVAWMGVF